MPLTEFQQEFLRNCSHRWNIKTGATRSGKTYLDCAVTIPKRICAARDEGLLVMLGNTLGTLERNVLEPMRSLWGPELVGVVRTSAAGNVVQLFGRKVYVLGADNKKHIARIQGAAFEYAYGDEITTWDEGVFQMLKSRLSCPHSHFDGTCNPDNPQHWFKRFLDSDADIYCQAYTIDDNPTLPPEFVAQLKKEYAGTVYYNRFILGQWAAAGGIIYRPFADSIAADDKRFLWPADKPCKPWRVHIGVDFGGNGSWHAFVATGILPYYAGVVGLASARIDPKNQDADYLAPAPLLVPVVYRPDAKRPFGHSRISRACMGLQQGALRTLKRSEISAEFYSFPQKYVLGTSNDAEQMDKWKATISSFLEFTKDEDGDKPVVGQFTQQSMSPYTEQLRTFAALFAGETGLTLDDLGFVTDNPSSAEAIKSSHESLRLAARKAQRTFGSGFLNAGYLAACMRDGIAYQRQQLYLTRPVWEPVFEPDAATLSGIGDAVGKINTAIPGYFGAENLRDLTGIRSES